MKKYRSIVYVLTAVVALGLGFLAPVPRAKGQAQSIQGGVSGVARQGGTFYATAFGTWRAQVLSGNTTTGASTSITVGLPSPLLDGSTYPITTIFNAQTLAPIIVADNNAETVTPTTVSVSTSCPVSNSGTAPAQCAVITGTFNNTHGQGAFVTSGTAGLAEAVTAARLNGGGTVVVDSLWAQQGGGDAMIYGLVPYPSVSIEDARTGSVQYWNVVPATTTALAAPTVLSAQLACDATHTFCSDATVAGSASWGSTVHGCITLVDIMGNESPCSADASYTSAASKAIDIGAPAAVTSNVVGWKPYLSVSGGSYALTYSLPLLTQPTVLQAVPVSAAVCTLTTLETVTPACAIGNTTYGQAASAVGAAGLFSAGGAQFTGYPVVTNTLAPEIGSVSATAYNPNEEAHATYKYSPGAKLGIPGVQSNHFVFPVTAAAQTTVGEVEASIPVGANFMNYVGRTVRVCGLIAKTSTTADTVDTIQLWWDAEGSNVSAGTPVELSSINLTEATSVIGPLAAAANFQFCQDLTTTVAATTATGGTITPGQGFMTVGQVSAGANSTGAVSALVAAVGSLNLALPAHISVLLTHTTGTDGAGSKLYGATLQVIN